MAKNSGKTDDATERQLRQRAQIAEAKVRSAETEVERMKVKLQNVTRLNEEQGKELVRLKNETSLKEVYRLRLQIPQLQRQLGEVTEKKIQLETELQGKSEENRKLQEDRVRLQNEVQLLLKRADEIRLDTEKILGKLVELQQALSEETVRARKVSSEARFWEHKKVLLWHLERLDEILKVEEKV